MEIIRDGFQRCSMFGKRCSMFAVVFDSCFVVFAASCCVRRCVHMLFCSHVVLFDCAVLLCSMFCSHDHCCVRYFVCTLSVSCALGFTSSNVPCWAVAVLFDVLFTSESERSVRCSLNGERLVRVFAFVFGERFVVFAGWIFLTGVRCSHNGVRSQSW